MKAVTDYAKLIELVKDEAIALRQHATPHELAMLDIDTLDNTPNDCIYGQMTGYCNSPRAVELIENCCSRVYESSDYRLNGSPKERTRSTDGGTIHYFSPIETMLAIADDKSPDFDLRITENIENLVSYLRGETDELIITEEETEVLV